jgi:hypothetical protein
MYQYFIQGWILASSLGESAPNAPYPAIIVYVLRLIKIPEGNTIKYIFLTPLTFCERLNLKQLCKRYSRSPPCNSFRPTASTTTVWRPNFRATYFRNFSSERRYPDQYTHSLDAVCASLGGKAASRCVRGKIENFARPEP